MQLLLVWLLRYLLVVCGRSITAARGIVCLLQLCWLALQPCRFEEGSDLLASQHKRALAERERYDARELGRRPRLQGCGRCGGKRGRICFLTVRIRRETFRIRVTCSGRHCFSCGLRLCQEGGLHCGGDLVCAHWV